MNRREFLVAFAAAAVLEQKRSAWCESQAPVSVRIGEETSRAVPADFLGLSYESAQLANPNFLSPNNSELVAIFRELATYGVLRLRGGSSEYTTYSEQVPSGPPPLHLEDSKTRNLNIKDCTAQSPWVSGRGGLELHLWAKSWAGTVENAVRESAAVQEILGRRLLAFQIGNEPDSFRNRYRPATYGPAEYLAEWVRFHDATAKANPKARFAGPDVSNELPYLTAFAEQAHKFDDIVLLTSHYYAMEPAGNPQATLENLLSPDPKLTTLKSRDFYSATTYPLFS